VLTLQGHEVQLPLANPGSVQESLQVSQGGLSGVLLGLCIQLCWVSENASGDTSPLSCTHHPPPLSSHTTHRSTHQRTTGGKQQAGAAAHRPALLAGQGRGGRPAGPQLSTQVWGPAVERCSWRLLVGLHPAATFQGACACCCPCAVLMHEAPRMTHSQGGVYGVGRPSPSHKHAVARGCCVVQCRSVA
jgi:hypothetical protein